MKTNHSQSMFGIVHTWPDTMNAEYENIMRLSHTAKSIGAKMIVIDNQGNPVVKFNDLIHDGEWSYSSPRDLDFVISLHFESPRLFDVYSYGALWNPLRFYFEWGYEKSLKGLISHNDFLTCDSALAEIQVTNKLASAPRCVKNFPKLYHTLSFPIIKPSLHLKPSVFYCGINWERINKSKGRYHDLLQKLDKSRLIAIYGPKRFHGVEPWAGYDSYQGELPFDGESLVRAIAKCGISLVLSSEAHQESGIMSNRLFESLAAGAIIIANDHPILRRYFQDTYFEIDTSQSDEVLYEQILTIYNWIVSNPLQARRKALKAQNIFNEGFSLDKCLFDIIKSNEARIQDFKLRSYSVCDKLVDVILFADLSDLDALSQTIESICTQNYHRLNIHICIDKLEYANHGEYFSLMSRASNHNPNIVLHQRDIYQEPSAGRPRKRRLTTGKLILSIANQIKGDYIVFANTSEYLFSDHLTTLARVLDDFTEAMVAASGVIIESIFDDFKIEKRLEYLIPFSASSRDLHMNHRYGSSFMFRTSLLEKISGPLMEHIDYNEFNYLLALSCSHSIVRSSMYATSVFCEHREQIILDSLLQPKIQHQLIKDAVNGSPLYSASAV